MSEEAPAPVALEILGIPEVPVEPGALIVVRVVTTCNDPISATEMKVLVTRTDEVNLRGDHLAQAASRRYSFQRSHRLQQVIFRANIIERGEQRYVDMPDEDGQANNEAQVSVTIPDHCPDTWRGSRYGAITYRLRVKMAFVRRSPGGSVRLRKEYVVGHTKELTVRNVKLISPSPPLKSRTFNKVFRSILMKKGMLTAKLELPSEVRQGQPITASLEVTNNTSRAIVAASLTLYQRLWLSAGRMLPQDMQQPLSSVLVPDVLLNRNSQWSGQVIDLTVPQSCLTSASFNDLVHFQVRFFVRLRLELKWMGSLNLDVNVTLGSDVRRPNPADLPSSSLLRNNLLVRQASPPPQQRRAPPKARPLLLY